jgi:ABC-2 type transport system ATP-binding protein
MAAQQEPAVIVKDLYKSFKLPHEQHSGIKQALINVLKGKRGYEVQQVLDDVSFEIKKGEFFGIVGRNGSGKSTLLKLLAGIYVPDKGLVHVNGSLTPFIELGVGFNPELTGRENVYMNGALLGFSKKEMEDMYDDIVEFAEIGRFMDQKLKNYSSGMQVRLAFSIAVRARSDVLLIDEVLAVGDTAFQQKCFKYFEKLKAEGRTIVFISHDMSAVKRFCSRAMLLTDGVVKMIGSPDDIAKEYERLNYGSMQVEGVDEKSPVAVKVYNSEGKETQSIEYGEKMTLEASWPKSTNVGIVGFALFRGAELIFASNSIDQSASFDSQRAQLKIKANIGNGKYKLVTGLFGESRHDVLETITGPEFLIFNQPNKGDHKEEWEGLTYIENTWQ